MLLRPQLRTTPAAAGCTQNAKLVALQVRTAKLWRTAGLLRHRQVEHSKTKLETLRIGPARLHRHVRHIVDVD